MPFFGTRRFDVHTKRTFMNDGSNRRGSNEEVVVGEMGQVGTQFDGFTHQTHEDSLYNCIKLDEIATRSGFTKLGIEKVGSLITRGVLIDVAALKGVEMLPDTLRDHPADLQQALERQKLTLQPGDAVLIHTGWSRLWGKDNARYVKSCPGHRHRRRDVARQAGSDARRRGQLAGRSRAEPGRTAVAPGPPADARRQRYPPAREPEARRAGRRSASTSSPLSSSRSRCRGSRGRQWRRSPFGDGIPRSAPAKSAFRCAAIPLACRESPPV